MLGNKDLSRGVPRSANLHGSVRFLGGVQVQAGIESVIFVGRRFCNTTRELTLSNECMLT